MLFMLFIFVGFLKDGLFLSLLRFVCLRLHWKPDRFFQPHPEKDHRAFGGCGVCGFSACRSFLRSPGVPICPFVVHLNITFFAHLR